MSRHVTGLRDESGAHLTHIFRYKNLHPAEESKS
jgi:hypothetical protein